MENNTANVNQENGAPAGKKKLPAYIILGIIALVAAVALAVTNMITKGPIQERAAAALRDAFNAVMPAESYEEITVPDGYEVSGLYAAKNGDEVVGYCVTASASGYNGPVAVNLGVGTDGLVTGCAVGDTSFAETPGFGARAKEESFQEQFIGIDAVNGGSFDALSGATVTSTAVLNATNEALRCVAEVALGETTTADPLVTFGAKEETSAPAQTAPLTGAVQEGSAKGFASDVKVQLTLDDAGAIAQLTIDASGETAGLGQLAMEEAFTSQFIGKAGPFTLGDGIDSVSGATITSQAAVDAINSALSAPASAGADVLTATAKGFASDVVVNITLENGAIAAMTVDASGETAGLGQLAMEEDFTSQFIGKTAPLTLGQGIDALSGATITSQAVVDAANDALSNAGSASAGDPGTVVAQDENTTVSVKDDGTASVTVNDGYTGDTTVTLTAEDGKITSGAIGAAQTAETAEPGEGQSASMKGFSSDVTVTATLEDGVITALTVDASGETAGFGQKCAEEDFTAQFIGKTLPVTLGEDVDAVAGATITSTAVVDALNSLAAVPAEEAAEEPVAEAPAAGEEATATMKGFASDVTVTATIEDGAITALTVDASGETAGFGQKCAEEDFTAQFIGKTLPVTLGEDVDAVAGATITSTAVVDALNSLVTPATEGPVDPDAEAAAPSEGQSATMKGFASDVTVTATIEDGAITALTVDASGETAGFGQKCAEEDFTSQFIGKTLPVTLGEDVDAVAGATITSTAVVDALNSLAAAPAEEAAEEPAAGEEATATMKGFASDVTVTATIEDGAITALTVDASGETAGFGQKCAEEDFTSQFIGKTLPVTLGEDVDAVAGATITSTAVVDALNSLAAAPAEEAEEAAEEPVAEAPAAGEEATATMKGFASDVTVTATLDNGTITALTVDASGETAGFGQKCAEEDFTSQFIGKTLPVTLGEDVDAVAGATITSTAVVDALNSLAAAPAEEAEETAEEPVAEAPAAGEEATATMKGFASDVTVTATLDNGTITALTVDASGETAGFGQKCAEEDFTSQFIGKTLPVTLGEDVDAVAGATITSTAVVDALNSLAAAPAEEAAEEPVAEAPAAGEEATATMKGFASDVAVTATIEDGAITALTVDASGETAGFGQKCAEEDFTSQFIGKTLPVTLGEDVDAVAGATITSTAVVDALNSLATAPAEEAAEEPVAEAPAAGEEATATMKGFASDVTVTATIEDGTITALTVDASGETAGFGQKCAEEDFTAQFIGKTLPVTLGEDVDAVAGATITSTAVVDALNSLAAAPAEEAAEEPAAGASTPENQLIATHQGFGGIVTVKAVLEEGKVVSLEVETPDETPGRGQKCSEEAFTSQFIGKTLPVTLGEDVDEVSGATITSTVVVNALNSLVK